MFPLHCCDEVCNQRERGTRGALENRVDVVIRAVGREIGTGGKKKTNAR